MDIVRIYNQMVCTGTEEHTLPPLAVVLFKQFPKGAVFRNPLCSNLGLVDCRSVQILIHLKANIKLSCCI